MLRTIVLWSTLLLITVSPSFAETRYVGAGDNLQTALNGARPGDELRLAPGATFTGNFVLPVIAGTSMITLRSDIPDAELPPQNQRVTPETAGRFARIVSPNTSAALRTAPGAHHWRVMFVEFPSTKEGYGDIIQLGDGSTAQTQVSQVPYEIVFDRVYIHGHPLYGQKRGIALNARVVTIRNSYISDIKGVGVDTQAIGGWNGPGPFSIENNYLEAAGEVILLGGADPAIPNLVSEDVSVRYNHMTRPMAWRDAIVDQPSNVTATGAEGGSLTAGVYTYRVVARRPTGQGTTGNSLPSAEVTAVATGGANRVSWAPVADATEYLVYGRNPAGVTQYWTVTSPTFTDTGAAGKAGAPPTAATHWSVKNLFELKNARRVRIEYNLFENNWQGAQQGYSILFTPRNQGGGCPWCVIEQVDFSHNIVRNVSSGFNIAGYDTNGVTGQTSTIKIQDNLVYGVTTTLGGAGWIALLGDAPRDVVFDHNTFDFDGTTLLSAYGGTKTAPRPITGFRYTNNASPHGTYGINGSDASTGTLTLQMYFPDAVVTGNWLSGGTPSRYPPGNRFDVPFDAKLTAGVTIDLNAAGANVGKLLQVIETVSKGLMIGVPQSPRNLRIISSGK
jgi:hypothetical protein